MDCVAKAPRIFAAITAIKLGFNSKRFVEVAQAADCCAGGGSACSVYYFHFIILIVRVNNIYKFGIAI